MQEKDQNTVRVREAASPFPRGKTGTSEGKRLSQEAQLGLVPSLLTSKLNTMPIVLGIFYFCVPLLPSPHPLPNFLVAKIRCGSVSVSALSQLLTLDQSGDMAALFSIPPSSISR